jgi:hypothetical protein
LEPCQSILPALKKTGSVSTTRLRDEVRNLAGARYQLLIHTMSQHQ